MAGHGLRVRVASGFWLLALLLGLVATPSGCERRDCEEERTHCEGNSKVSCVSPCSDVGCHRTFEYEQCDKACVTADDGFPFCALSNDPDPNCVAAESCGPNGPIQCLAGYRVRELSQCEGKTHCVVAMERAFCALGGPDPRCADDAAGSSATCDGKKFLSCALGFAIEDTVCADACVAGVGCALSDVPDPRCVNSIAYCDGDTTLVSCNRGYQAERRKCNCISPTPGNAHCE